MSLVNVINVIVLNPKTTYADKISFEIFFEALQPLQHSLTWRIQYVGQASDPQYDQILTEVEMDCPQPGQMKFVLEGDAPNHNQLPVSDIVGVTAVLLTCSYKDSQEFLRVGYYVNVEYDSPELNENPPATPTIERLHRHILAEKPRVTKFQIDWDDMPQAMGGNVDENPAAAQANAEGLLQKGSQFQDRQDLMSHAALAEAAQNFQGGAQM